jgi:hypothetical protein
MKGEMERAFVTLTKRLRLPLMREIRKGDGKEKEKPTVYTYIYSRRDNIEYTSRGNKK